MMALKFYEEHTINRNDIKIALFVLLTFFRKHLDDMWLLGVLDDSLWQQIATIPTDPGASKFSKPFVPEFL